MVQAYAAASQPAQSLSPAPRKDFNYLPLGQFWSKMPDNQRAGICVMAGIDEQFHSWPWGQIDKKFQRLIIEAFAVKAVAIGNFAHYCNMASKRGYPA